MPDPTLDHFATVARQTVAELPEQFQSYAAVVQLCVAEVPEAEILAEMGIDDPLALTGLYEGVPLTEKHLWDAGGEPDTVWLFRQPILSEWRDRGNVALDDLIAHVVIHEFAHHFGWSDTDIARIDRWWE